MWKDDQQTILLSPPHRDKTHVDWVKAYTSIWTDLQKYIKDHHTTGLAWSKTVSPLKITKNSLVASKNVLHGMFWAGRASQRRGFNLLKFLNGEEIIQNWQKWNRYENQTEASSKWHRWFPLKRALECVFRVLKKSWSNSAEMETPFSK